jgi:GNAT superfamily N-acetyltransferase
MTSTPTPAAPLTFRRTTDGDLPFLRYLYGTTREEEMQVAPWTEEEKIAFVDMQFRAQKMHYDLHYPNAEFLIIESAGEPAGRLYIDRRPDEIEIVDITLLPTYRGRGLGGRLLQDILDQARSAGQLVLIYVENFNPARHLYDRLGFRQVDDVGVYHVMEWRAE